MTALNRFRGCLLGLACGDAVGTAVELRPRGTFPPVTDMVGGGPYHLESGQWTGDTSMALCLATSLISQKRFDVRDQMERYSQWKQEGYLSSTGGCFDIGSGVSAALARFRRTGDPLSGSTDPIPASNGSITRLAPVPMFFHPNWIEAVRLSGESSKTTHGARECVDACTLFGAMLFKALDGQHKDEVLFGRHFHRDREVSLTDGILSIARGDYRDHMESSIRGSSYVVKNLEAALWCFYRNDSYEDAVLSAANLGEDADATAAVCGQIAGAHYGESAIPASWRGKVAMRKLIEALAEGLYAGSSARGGDANG